MIKCEPILFSVSNNNNTSSEEFSEICLKTCKSVYHHRFMVRSVDHAIVKYFIPLIMTETLDDGT